MVLFEHMPGRPETNIVITWLSPKTYAREGYEGAWWFGGPESVDGYMYVRFLGLEISVW